MSAIAALFKQPIAAIVLFVSSLSIFIDSTYYVEQITLPSLRKGGYREFTEKGWLAETLSGG